MYSPEFEVWRERQEELVREAQRGRLARQIRKGQREGSRQAQTGLALAAKGPVLGLSGAAGAAWFRSLRKY